MKYFLFGIAFILICLTPTLAKSEVRIQVGPVVFHFPSDEGDYLYNDRRFDQRRNQRRRFRRHREYRDPPIDNKRNKNRFVNPNKIPLRSSLPSKSIFVSTKHKKLYYILNKREAIAYPIAVGKDGFAWSGREKVTAIKHWPDWFPPTEMRLRKPELPIKVSGGPQNPLGAAAIYLGDTLYRIHGTNEPSKIGQAVSSGCIRMHNSHVKHLIRRIGIGTLVIVR